MHSEQIKHILVATDFSENANLALRWAIKLFGASKGTITLAHAVGPQAIRATASYETVFTEVKQHLAVAGDPARKAGHVVEHRYATEKPWTLIGQLAEELNVDLIVLGTHGHGTLGEFVLGSTADRVVRTSKAPVLIVHPKDEVPRDPIRSIFVPHDFSDEANTAARMAATILHQSGGGELTLFHACEVVVQYPNAKSLPIDERYWQECERQAREKLDDAAKSIATTGVQVRTLTDRGIPSSSAVAHAKSMNAKLIAMGTHGRGTLQRWLIGSVAERVLQIAPCPVLTVRHKT